VVWTRLKYPLSEFAPTDDGSHHGNGQIMRARIEDCVRCRLIGIKPRRPATKFIIRHAKYTVCCNTDPLFSRS